MAKGLIPYDPNLRPGSGKSDETGPGDKHFHYHDHRTFVHGGDQEDEPDEEEREPILLKWQKNALGLIAILAALGAIAHSTKTETTVTTTTVETNVVDSDPLPSTNLPAATDDTRAPSAAVSAGINTMAEATTADQMLEEWSRVATGSRSTNGFLLVNGRGSPGEGCNAHEGKHLLKFGAMMGGQSGVPIPDYFGGTFLDIGATVGGAYWYNNQDNVLITRRLEMKEINGSGHKSLEDGAEKVEALSPGIVLIKGVRFHQCVL